MRVAPRLALRNLRSGGSGLGLLFFCLFLSIAAIASVTSLVASINGAITANGRSLLGGDLMLSLASRTPSDTERRAIAALGATSHSVTLRAMLVTPSSATALAEVTGADNAYPLVGTIDLSGPRPHGAEIAVGRELAERLDLRKGSSVRLGRSTFRVVAILGKLPGSGFGLAPPALIDSAGLAATGLVQPGSLTTDATRVLLPATADPAAVGAAFQAQFPDAGWRVTDRGEAGAGTLRLVDRVGQILLLVGLAALAIGGLGIASAAAAFAESRRSSVAILKLVGATPARIRWALGLEIGAVAGLATLAGCAFGAAVPALAATKLGALFPVVPERAPQWAALGIAALYALLATTAAVWQPMASALATRPAELLRADLSGGRFRRGWWVTSLALLLAVTLAIATASAPLFAASAIAAALAAALLFAGLGWLIRRAARRLARRGGPIMRLGLSALDRPGAATVRLSVALGLGLGLLIALASVGQGLLAELDTTVPRRAPALFFVDIPRAAGSNFAASARRLAPGAQVRVVPSLRGPVTAIKGVPVAQLTQIPEGAWVLRGDRGLTFASTLPTANRIVAGHWWPVGYRGPPLVSLDVDAATALGLKVGDSLTVSVLGRPVTATIASLRQIDWRSMGFNFAIIFSPGVLDHAPYTLMATVGPASDPQVTALERTTAASLPMVSSIRVGDVIAQVRGLLVALELAVRAATGFAILVGMIVLTGSVLATRRARTRDIVLLKLVGASPAQLIAAQLVEFAALATTVCLAALAIGSGAGLAILSWMGITAAPNWPSLIGIAAVGGLLAMLAALISARPALVRRPAEALRTL